MDYLVDENLSKSDKFLLEHREFRNVRHLMKPGAKDKEIIERAKREGFVILTQDIKLALHGLVAGVKVWYFNVEEGTDHKLSATMF
jgi:predicted nuclease of predicted toxin-antitoxin system